MRSRKAANDHVAQVARRRLELLSAELAGLRQALPQPPDPVEPPAPVGPPSPRHEAPAPVDRATRAGRHAQRSVRLSGRVRGWVHDRLPPTLQGRVGLTSGNLTVVALLVAAGLAVTAWWVVSAAPHNTTTVPAVARPSAPASSSALAVVPAADAVGDPAGDAADATSTSGPQMLVIDVAGKVRRPGIATLPVGSRVVDALKAAGGARRGVVLTSLNLARLLVDGEQVVVGMPSPTGVAAPAASAPGVAGSSGPGQLVNINSATLADLDTLPGIGPVTAESILAWRTENGSFSAVDELLEVSGIGELTLADIAPFVTI